MEAWQTVLAVSGAIAILAGGASGLYVLIVRPGQKFRQFTEKVGDFLEDWTGTEERPGVPARPGVMVRLQVIEDQLHADHGTTLRDAVNRVEHGVRRVEDSLAAHLAEHRTAAGLGRQYFINVPWPPQDDQEGESDAGDRP